ncbi:hypothetical protein [Paenibacillus sp. FSL K6-2859]|uniref:hypothetical protein n=1 Tax=Paenibacillus sp. FSL K6-2859 TaxID=2921482 RepID=UPI0030F4DFDB
MKVETLYVNYIIDGKPKVIPTKMFYEELSDGEMRNIRFEVQLNNICIQSKSTDSTEYAIKYLQKEISDNIVIACCQSCRHGNYNPFGDNENQIFCFEDLNPSDKDEVVKIFITWDRSFETRSRKLLDFCRDFKPVSHNEKYTYNDWGLENL